MLQHRTSQRGFTLVELAVSAVILVVMVVVIGNLASTGTKAQEYAKRLNRVTEIGQDIADTMRLDLLSCVRLFGASEASDAPLTYLDLEQCPLPLDGSRLPLVSSASELVPDTGVLRTVGNSLFFARLAWVDRFECPSGNSYLVDVHRWVYYYLTPEGVGPQPGCGHGLNLVRFQSEPMADAEQVAAIPDAADRVAVLAHLRTASPDATGMVRDPVRLAWNRNSGGGGLPMFQEIQANGSLASSSTSGSWKLAPSDTPQRGILSYRHHSVATNFCRFDGEASAVGVARWSQPSFDGAGFPHGFEVKVGGPSSGRKVAVNLCIVSTQIGVQLAWYRIQPVYDVREI
ncbi:MAG: hypothetical protein RL148_779 [Planctomycetota bacterium]|jgi:prepilin-type N-terminal cleavage/methylation domain-containing protein